MLSGQRDGTFDTKGWHFTPHNRLSRPSKVPCLALEEGLSSTRRRPLFDPNASLCGFPFGKYHADDDECATEQEPDGDMLAEQPPGKEDGEDGVEVDPVGGYHRSQLTYYPVPQDVAQHAGHHAQEQQVPKHVGTQDDLEWWEARNHYIIRYDGDESVEEHLAGDEKSVVTLQGRFHQ